VKNLKIYILSISVFIPRLEKVGNMKCTGCHDHGQCTIQTKGSVAMDDCPCRKCLIKGVCLSICEDLANHYNEVNTGAFRLAIKKEEKKK